MLDAVKKHGLVRKMGCDRVAGITDEFSWDVFHITNDRFTFIKIWALDPAHPE